MWTFLTILSIVIMLLPNWEYVEAIAASVDIDKSNIFIMLFLIILVLSLSGLLFISAMHSELIRELLQNFVSATENGDKSFKHGVYLFTIQLCFWAVGIFIFRNAIKIFKFTGMDNLGHILSIVLAISVCGFSLILFLIGYSIGSVLF